MIFHGGQEYSGGARRDPSLPALIPATTQLSNAIIVTGGMPSATVELHVASLEKPKQNQTEGDSKRPTSLTHAIPKALESTELNRVLPAVEHGRGGAVCVSKCKGGGAPPDWTTHSGAQLHERP